MKKNPIKFFSGDDCFRILVGNSGFGSGFESGPQFFEKIGVNIDNTVLTYFCFCAVFVRKKYFLGWSKKTTTSFSECGIIIADNATHQTLIS